MVELGVTCGVTGSPWRLSIVFWKLTIALAVFIMTWHRCIVQLSTSEETLVNQDWVRYSTNELKFIRSECQKDPKSKMIPFPALQCIRNLGFKEEGKEAGEGCYQGNNKK